MAETTEAGKRICPHCKQATDAKTRVCGNCGAYLGSEETAFLKAQMSKDRVAMSIGGLLLLAVAVGIGLMVIFSGRGCARGTAADKPATTETR